MRLLAPFVLASILVPACKPGDQEPEDGLTMLTPREQLLRVSVDLRGVHPTEDELAFIEQYPGAYEEFVDRYLQDERFLGRFTEILDDTIRTRTGELMFDPDEYGLEGIDETRIADSLGDEPLMLAQHIVANDLPWSDLVLADYTMADPIVAAAYDLDRDPEAVGWVPARYTDDRPMVGILSSTTIWSRYPSAGVNSNRHRANNMSRMLLCDDYLSRPVSFSRSQIDALTDPDTDPNEVIRQNGVCQSCHSTLDPLAAHFYGFWWEKDDSPFDQSLYYPEDEELWRDYAGATPAYYGLPTQGLDELAVAIAEDDRFVDCATKTMWEGLTQRHAVDGDWTELQVHRNAFAGNELKMRPLVKSIVMSREYLAGYTSDPLLATRLPTLKQVRPSQLQSIIRDLTGYDWTFDGRGMDRNARGLSVLAGGTDDRYVTAVNHDPSVGLLFVQERLGQAAAWHVAEHDLDPNREDEAILLKYVTENDTPEANRDAFATQIEELYLRVTGKPLVNPADFDKDEEVPEAAEVEELITLWKQLYSVNASPEAAWAGVVSVVLRDPDVLFY